MAEDAATDKSPSELIQQIRFALDQLGDTNGHFVFERVCFVFARRRISRNLLPATGPVAAGGDQGRDGESFWTEIPDPTGGRSSRVGDGALVLACTTQKESVAGKIAADLVKITASGTPVERVAYFTVASIPVAVRHDLQAAALEDHGIQLEVFDGVALSEHLADPELFWAASEYLKIPASFAPTPLSGEQLPGWYLSDIAQLRSGAAGQLHTFGALTTLRDLARYATFHSDAQGDLTEIIPALAEFAANANDTEIVQRARYELAVAALRGQDDLTPHDETVREFFRALRSTPDDLPLLHDAVNLLSYGMGAWGRDRTRVEISELEQWYAELVGYIGELLAANSSPNRAASLRSALARLLLFPGAPGSLEEAGSEEQWDGDLDVLDSIEVLPFEIPLRNADQAIELVEQILDDRELTPTFPVGSLATSFDFLDLSLSRRPGYRQVRDKLDAALAEVEGSGATAVRAHRRAGALLEAGRPVDAINEIHAATIGWWRGDAVVGSIKMFMLAGDVYGHLGMTIAAKQLALAAAAIAWTSIPRHRDLFADALLDAAMNDYFAGQWATAVHQYENALRYHQEGSEHPFDPDHHAGIGGSVDILHLILRAAEDFVPEYLPILGELGKASDEDDEAGEAGAGVVPDWWSLAGLAQQSDRTLLGRPFSDVGPRRQYRWKFQGNWWAAQCENERATVLATERLVAALQVFQVATAQTALVWAPGDIRLDVALGDSAFHEIEVVHDGPERHWNVTLAPRDGDPVAHSKELVLTVVELVYLNALTAEDDLRTILDHAVTQGLLSKLLAGRPYDELADTLDDDVYAILSGATRSPFLEPALIAAEKERELSAAPVPPLPYDRDDVLATIQSRYDNVMNGIPHTLAWVSGDKSLRQMMVDLRAEGWLDWQLISALFVAVGNSRLSRSGLLPDGPMSRKQAEELEGLMRRPEGADDPPPLDDYMTATGFRQLLLGTVVATLPSLGLSPRAVRDPEALLGFLVTYFNYFEDDVEHTPFFESGDEAVT